METNELVLLDEKRTDRFHIDPRTIIVIEDFNVRSDEDYGTREEMEILKNSILVNGIISDMSGYRHPSGIGTILTDGHRRNRGIQELITEGRLDIDATGFRVPIRLEKKGFRPEDRIMQMFHTQDNKKLSDVSVGNLFYRLSHIYGFSNADIAKRTGRSTAYVNNMLTLAAAPIEVRNAVKTGKIKTTAAVKEVKKSNKEQQTNSSPTNNVTGEELVARIAKAKEDKKLEAPIGYQKRFKEFIQIATDQSRCPSCIDTLQVAFEFLFENKSIADALVELEAIETAPTLSA